MPRKKAAGHYKVGEVSEKPYHGTYGVIQGNTANDNDLEEWKGFIGLLQTKWFVYRHYDDGGVRDMQLRLDLVEYYDTKAQAMEEAERRVRMGNGEMD